MGSIRFLICDACGTQFDTGDRNYLTRCKICDDPRQFVPQSGQSWTTLAELRSSRKNRWFQDSKNPNLWIFWTEPKFAIGQTASLIRTSRGNIMWDLVSLLDDETTQFINSLGGIETIVISHPHWYTTYREWARAFNCSVQVSREDEQWLCSGHDCVKFIEDDVTTILDGVDAYKAGGHFPGSLILHWEKILFHADTIVVMPSGLSPEPRSKDHLSFTFQWSIPNMIPLSPDAIHRIWSFVKQLDFETTRGGFLNSVIHAKDLKRKILESAQAQVRAMGWDNHRLLEYSA